MTLPRLLSGAAVPPLLARRAGVALLALALAWGLVGRCTRAPDSTPEGAARAFVEAARLGDRQGVWNVLDARTRTRLEKAAAATEARLGGTQRMTALDALSLTATERHQRPSSFEVTTRSDGAATVTVHGPDGESSALQLVREHGRWRVALALP